ncbi:MAG: hypothetical protein ACAF41_13780 [Leptolyngbya sp. BL-A-14]
MICIPLPTSYSARQQRPHCEWSLAVVLFEVKGVSTRFRSNLLRGNLLQGNLLQKAALSTGVFVTGMTLAGLQILAELQIIDRPTESGWCRRGFAPE